MWDFAYSEVAICNILGFASSAPRGRTRRNAVITTTILRRKWLVRISIDLIVYQFMIYFTTLFGIRKVLFLPRYIEKLL
jgi:hypothetical protein